jgi:two-component system alkaline phosphatase synthesis response regulator PhoP
MLSKNKILFINLKKEIVDEIDMALSKNGIISYSSYGFSENLKMARLCIPNIFIISESIKEGKPGLQLISLLRDNAVFRESFIIYMTDQNDEEGQIEAFEAGAEDILPNSVSVRVLIGHISSIIKRFKRLDENICLNENILIDPESLTVIIEGRIIPMVKKEFELLQLLCSSPNRIFFRKEILQHLWNDSQLKTDRTLDVHIRRLRKKLGISNIKTVIGMGYKYEWNPS